MKTIEDVVNYVLENQGPYEAFQHTGPTIQLSLYEASHPQIKKMIDEGKIQYVHAQNISAKLVVLIGLVEDAA